MPKVLVEVEEFRRSWAMAKHDAGEKVEGTYDVLGEDEPRSWFDCELDDFTDPDVVEFRLHVAPPQPITLMPGTPEHRKYLAADALASVLDNILDNYSGFWKPHALTALMAYRGEGEL